MPPVCGQVPDGDQLANSGPNEPVADAADRVPLMTLAAMRGASCNRPQNRNRNRSRNMARWGRGTALASPSRSRRSTASKDSAMNGFSAPLLGTPPCADSARIPGKSSWLGSTLSRPAKTLAAREDSGRRSRSAWPRCRARRRSGVRARAPPGSERRSGRRGGWRLRRRRWRWRSWLGQRRRTASVGVPVCA
jgi:hypothetical protein